MVCNRKASLGGNRLVSNRLCEVGGTAIRGGFVSANNSTTRFIFIVGAGSDAVTSLLTSTGGRVTNGLRPVGGILDGIGTG